MKSNQTKPNEMETVEAPKLLDDMMKERPADFDFSDMPDASPGRASEGTSATLTQILGGFTQVGRDEVTGVVFYARKPKLNGLERILTLMNSPLDGKAEATGMDALKSMMRRLRDVAALLVYVQDARQGWRPATVEEIGDAFDISELKGINARFGGMSQSGEGDEGNA